MCRNVIDVHGGCALAAFMTPPDQGFKDIATDFHVLVHPLLLAQAHCPRKGGEEGWTGRKLGQRKKMPREK